MSSSIFTAYSIVSSVPICNLVARNLDQAVHIRTLSIQIDGFLPDGVFSEVRRTYSHTT